MSDKPESDNSELNQARQGQAPNSASTDITVPSSTGADLGGAAAGGLGANIEGIDVAQAQQVGADPPGGLGLDIGGGTDGLGAVDTDDSDALADPSI